MRTMKNSGVEWIGEIPKDWEIHRMKSCISERTSGAWGNEATGKDGDIICLRIADFDYSKFRFKDCPIDELTRRNYDKDTIDRLSLCKGDILIEKSGGGEKTPVGRTVIFDKDYNALYANFMDRLRCTKLVTTVWMQYVFVVFYKNDYSKNYVKQTTGIQNLDLTSMLANERIPIPPVSEQQYIADYLDTQCDHIDSVIEKTCSAIEEYKKLKQAVITQAVTKGIRPNREMKDSGTGYIEQIPVEWEVVKLRYLGICQNGISKGGEYFGSGFPFVSYSDVYKNMELPLQVEKLVESTEEEQDRYSVLEGDIFFTRTSETIEEIGFTSVCKQTIEKATFAGFLIRVRPVTQKLLIGFSKYYFRSEIHRQYFVKEMNLVTRASLGQELLKKLPVLVPSITEQSEIVAYLDEKTAAIDSLIQKKEQLITELEDYKKSLIYEYVTGKKEVI